MLYASESTSEYPQFDDDLSDSDDTNTEFEFEISDSEDIYLDDDPQDSFPEEFNSLDVAAPLIELPILREGIQAAYFQIPTSDEIATAQLTDAELKQLKQWIEEKGTLSIDELAPQSGHLKCFAQLLNEMSLHDSVIILRRSDDPQRELIGLPSSLIERVIFSFTNAHEASIKPPRQTRPKS